MVFFEKRRKTKYWPFQGNRYQVYKLQNFNLGGPNLLLGRTSFSGMLKVVMSEPPFRDKPYTCGPGITRYKCEPEIAMYKLRPEMTRYYFEPETTKYNYNPKSVNTNISFRGDINLHDLFT